MSKINFQYIRYYLEMIAFPFFLFLVFHFAAHGTGVVLNSFEVSKLFLENFPPIKMIAGIVFLVLFTWIWHRPNFKRWIPCSHEHCHEGTKYLHALAILAFCLHFFPEAIIRAELLADFSFTKIISISALVGFLVHFIIDVVTGIMLSLYWKTLTGRIISFTFIISTWLIAFFLEKNLENAHDSFEIFPGYIEGGILIFGAFLLAMFVHLPHKPIITCGSCNH